MANFKWGDRVFFADRKSPLRVIGQGKIEGERALQLASDFTGVSKAARREWIDKSKLIDRSKGVLSQYIARTVPVADLVRDGRNWRERWRQLGLDLDLDRAPGSNTKMDPEQ